MWFKRKKHNILNVFDERGFNISISVKRFNKIDVFVDSNIEEIVVDAHFSALDSYNSYLLSSLLNKNKIEIITQDLLSVGRIKWNPAKVYGKIEHIVKRFLRKLGFIKFKNGGGEG